MPANEGEVTGLHLRLLECQEGQMVDGWGEVSFWPAERMKEGDWSPAIWRSPELAEAGRHFANHREMRTIRDYGFSCHKTNAVLTKTRYKKLTAKTDNSFPILDSAGANGQKTIRSLPDAQWKLKTIGEKAHKDRLLAKSGFLLITFAQNSATARLTAVADDKKYIGRGWLPITGPNSYEAKSISVFINSTAGRLQLARNAGRTLIYPQYNPTPIEGVRIPNIRNSRIQQALYDCWERTKDMEVPQFRDGECEVREIWDNAVADAMGWDRAELARLRNLLHKEPHVRGLGYNQYSD